MNDNPRCKRRLKEVLIPRLQQLDRLQALPEVDHAEDKVINVQEAES